MSYVPYTYLIKCPNGMFYYGVKYANNSRDVANPSTFWKDYFTSCVEVKLMLTEHSPDDFKFWIRKTFNTAKEAIAWESKVNRRLTTKSAKFINNSFMDGRDQAGCNNGHYGKKHSDSAKLKAVATLKTRGARPSKVSYFCHWYVDEYKELLSECVTPYPSVFRFLKKYVKDKNQ